MTSYLASDVRRQVITAASLTRLDVLITRLGGNPRSLFGRAGIPIEALMQPNSTVLFQRFSNLLELAAATLNCSTFGMQLAKIQEGRSPIGSLDVAMRNAPTLDDAYRFCAAYSRMFSPIITLSYERNGASSRHFIRYEIEDERDHPHCQLIEYVLAWFHVSSTTLSRGQCRPAEIWMEHGPVAPVHAYRSFFGTRVGFNRPMSALFLRTSDLRLPLCERDPLLHEIASSYVESHYVAAGDDIEKRARNLIMQRISHESCTHVEIAGLLGLHPRAFQRALTRGGQNFEKLKDDVRRKRAIQLLTQQTIPLSEVAAQLGYSEHSVLTRSCRRWFGMSPRTIRAIQGEKRGVDYAT